MFPFFLDLSQEDKWTDRQTERAKPASMFLHIGLFTAISLETNSSLQPLVQNLATAEQTPCPALGFVNAPCSLFQLASFKYGRSPVGLDFSDLMHVLYIQLSN
jgi:hypothetical protein